MTSTERAEKHAISEVRVQYKLQDFGNKGDIFMQNNLKTRTTALQLTSLKAGKLTSLC